MTLKRNLILAIALICLGLGLFSHLQRPAPQWEFALEEFPVSPGSEPVFGTIFDYAPAKGEAHSAAIRLHDDGFSLIWFEGSRESANDVDILHSRFRHTDSDYDVQPPAVLLDRLATGQAMVPPQVVMTLGNTIENHAVDNGVFATVVSLGGWAMASVADVRLGQDGPLSARKLNLSPILNRSHLVRAPMLRYRDGDHLLPVYFEMGSAMSEVVRIGPDGRVSHKARIPQSHPGIQPMVVALDAQNAIALLRNFRPGSDRLLASWSDDGGQSWSPSRALDLPNPNAPVAALRLGAERLLMAYNNHATRADLLTLALSDDGGHSWRDIKVIEDAGGDANADVRYPMMRQLPNGHILLVYSHSSKRGIRALVFNTAWINAQ